MNNSTKKIIEELAQSFLSAYKIVLESDIGINNKTGTNTLVDSKLYKTSSIKINNNDDAVVSLLINEYEVYVQNGRKSPKMPPVAPIIAWAKSKRIPTDNNTIWAIRKSIADKGIKPRRFIPSVWEHMDENMDKVYFDNIFKSIISEINQYFNS